MEHKCDDCGRLVGKYDYIYTFESKVSAQCYDCLVIERNTSEIKFDFELPYSSLPPIIGIKQETKNKRAKSDYGKQT